MKRTERNLRGLGEGGCFRLDLLILVHLCPKRIQNRVLASAEVGRPASVELRLLFLGGSLGAAGASGSESLATGSGF